MVSYDFPWSSYGFPYGFPMVSYGFHIVSHGFLSFSLCFSYGLPWLSVWFSYRFPMVFLSFSFGIPMASYRFPYGFLMVSIWFPMVFRIGRPDTLPRREKSFPIVLPPAILYQPLPFLPFLRGILPGRTTTYQGGVVPTVSFGCPLASYGIPVPSHGVPIAPYGCPMGISNKNQTRIFFTAETGPFRRPRNPQGIRKVSARCPQGRRAKCSQGPTASAISY